MVCDEPVLTGYKINVGLYDRNHLKRLRMIIVIILIIIIKIRRIMNY
jgi:hypothetical protein